MKDPQGCRADTGSARDRLPHRVPVRLPERLMVAVRAALVGVALVGCLTLLGCGSEQGYHGFNFDNHTDVAVTVFRVMPDGTEIGVVSRLDPGTEHSVPGFPGLSSSGSPCAVMTLVARDRQGVEVARREGELCMDEAWAIGGGAEPDSPAVLFFVAIAAFGAAPLIVGLMVVIFALCLALTLAWWIRRRGPA